MSASDPPARPIAFAGLRLDRADHERRSEAWLRERLEREESRFLPFWRLQVLVRSAEPASLAWARGAVREFADPRVGAVLLGMAEGVAHWAVDVSGLADPVSELGLDGAARFEDVRAAAARLPADEVAAAGHGRARVDWHARHGFCPACGGRTAPRAGGAHRQCESCDGLHFPRTDPVVIAVVGHGERCLLGRQRGWPAAMYSALAGFVETGETIEEAVRREVREETGVVVGPVRYRLSQPWPFPSSLMLGCLAEARSEELAVDRAELEDARWFDRAAVRRALAADPAAGLVVPPPLAVAHHLVRQWAEGAEEPER